MSLINNSTLLINVVTGEYPAYLGKVRRDNPNVSLPQEPSEELLSSLGYAVVAKVDRPQGDVVTEGTPVEVDGKYVQVFEVRDFNAEELAQQLESKKQELHAKVNNMRNAELNAGFEHISATGAVFTVQTRLEDRLNLMYLNMVAQQMIAAGDETPQVFRSAENVTQMLTPSELLAMSVEALNHYRNVLGASWTLKDQIDATQSADQLPVIPEKLVA